MTPDIKEDPIVRPVIKKSIYDVARLRAAYRGIGIPAWIAEAIKEKAERERLEQQSRA